MDLVRIIGLELDCIVGIWAYERDRVQRVRLDLALGVDARRAGRSGRIAQTVDYDRVAHQVMAMLQFRRYQLIEMAAEELCAMLLATQPELLQVQLSIEKPGALEGRAQGARIEVVRVAADFAVREWERPFGTERQVLATRDATSSVIELAPGSSWSPPNEDHSRGLFWVLRGELMADGRPCAPGEIRSFERAATTSIAGVGSELCNPSSEPAQIFISLTAA